MSYWIWAAVGFVVAPILGSFIFNLIAISIVDGIRDMLSNQDE